MTDETFEAIQAYCTRRCPRIGDIYLARAKVVVDDEVPVDTPVFVDPPAPPEIRLPMSDFVDLDQRAKRLEVADADSELLDAFRYPSTHRR